MLELDGIPYKRRSPQEILSDMCNYINNYCVEHNIRDSEGAIAYIDKSWGSLAYLLLYGEAYQGSILEEYLYSLGRNINIQASSPTQLLELAALAGVHRKQPTVTTVPVAISAVNNIPVGKMLHITKGLVCSYTTSNVRLSFTPAYALDIGVGQTRIVVLKANRSGSYNVPAGALTGFDTTVEYLNTFVNGVGTPGKALESIQQLRARMLKRTTESTMYRRCADAIEALNGVAACNIVFNTSNELDIVIPRSDGAAIILKPRTAALFVQGYSDYIADTVVAYLNCPFAGLIDGPGGTVVQDPRCIRQSALLTNNQRMFVYFYGPTYKDIHIAVYLPTVPNQNRVAQIRSAITSLALYKTIGEKVTSNEILQAIHNANVTTEVTGVLLGSDASHVTDTYVNLNADEVGNYSPDNVTFIEAL